MNRRHLLAPIGLAVALVGCGGGGSAAPAHPKAPATLTVSGHITVEPTFNYKRDKIGQRCTAYQDYSDIAEGTQVVVEDDTGKTVALGSLLAGTITGKVGKPVFTEMCKFDFFVSGVPASHPFYRISVGRRGAQQFTRAQLGSEISLKLS